jgi:hypothetical protein
MSGILVNTDEMIKHVRRDFPVKFCIAVQQSTKVFQSGKTGILMQTYPNVRILVKTPSNIITFPIYNYDRNARFCMWKGLFWFKNDIRRDPLQDESDVANGDNPQASGINTLDNTRACDEGWFCGHRKTRDAVRRGDGRAL